MGKEMRSGFRELPHTADWALEVWAPDLEGLFIEAARGMFILMGVHIQKDSHVNRSFQLKAADAEAMLVKFLSELLFFLEQDRFAFNQIHLHIDKNSLEAHLEGGVIVTQSKEIKAVTYHNLKIQDENGYIRVIVVFDV